jgi:enamine deaminase RidA (YjgF/YER057c/UK114 family)
MFEDKIKELGYSLPAPPKPLAAYIPAIVIDEFVFTAGQLPSINGKLQYEGKVGSDINEDEGKMAAEICALNCLSVIKDSIGSLNKIEQIVKLTVFVNSADGFTKQPQVANGASELIGKIFGEKGKHVRSAVGVNELPINAPVEVEMIARIKI